MHYTNQRAGMSWRIFITLLASLSYMRMYAYKTIDMSCNTGSVISNQLVTATSVNYMLFVTTCTTEGASTLCDAFNKDSLGSSEFTEVMDKYGVALLKWDVPTGTGLWASSDRSAIYAENKKWYHYSSCPPFTTLFRKPTEYENVMPEWCKTNTLWCLGYSEYTTGNRYVTDLEEALKKDVSEKHVEEKEKELPAPSVTNTSIVTNHVILTAKATKLPCVEGSRMPIEITRTSADDPFTPIVVMADGKISNTLPTPASRDFCTTVQVATAISEGYSYTDTVKIDVISDYYIKISLTLPLVDILEKESVSYISSTNCHWFMDYDDILNGFSTDDTSISVLDITNRTVTLSQYYGTPCKIYKGNSLVGETSTNVTVYCGNGDVTIRSSGHVKFDELY